MSGPSIITAERHVTASPAAIFALLADPSAHALFDGSDMVQGAKTNDLITKVGQQFISTMHRMGRDYEMINHIVEFEENRRIVWAPSPGDLDTAGDDPSKIGVPAGYLWGYALEPAGDGATVVTEFFDCGPGDNRWITNDGGSWIHGSQTIKVSMEVTLERIAQIATGSTSSST